MVHNTNSLGEPEGGGSRRAEDHYRTRLQGSDGKPVKTDPGLRQQLLEAFRRRQREAPASSPSAFDVKPPTLVRSNRKVRVAQPGEPGQLNWTPLGPSVMKNGQAATNPAVSGRVHGLAFSADAERVYVAAANGGVWRSDDKGKSWYPLMNGFDLSPMAEKSDSLATGAIAVPASDPDRIYVGSGEGGDVNDFYYGVGPVVSEDGGVNWRAEPSDSPALPSKFFNLAIDPNDPEYVMAASNQGILRRQPRNQEVPGLPEVKPQSYLLKYSPGGAPSFEYWDQDGNFLHNAWTGVPGGDWAGNLTFIPFLLNKEPHFLTYNAATSAYVLYLFQGNADPLLVQQGNFTNGLQLMPFEMSGATYMVQYKSTTGDTQLIKWESDGTTTNQWAAAQNWGTGYELVPMIIGQVPMFLRYKPADGEVMLRRWRVDLTAVNVWAAVKTWDADRKLMPFQLNFAPKENQNFTLTYANDGSYKVYDWNGTSPRRVLRRPANSLPPESILVPYELKTPQGIEPRFFAYRTRAPGRGTTVQYSWGTRGPEAFRKEMWDLNQTFMPILMGYQWSNRQAFVEPSPIINGQEQRRVSSVAVARNGDVTVWYAAYWYPVTGNQVIGQGPVYFSLDRGQTWKSLGFFPRQQGRITLATQPGNVSTIYALTELGTVYRMERSMDPVTRAWNPILNTPNNLQGSFVLSMAVAPDNPNRIYLGGTSIGTVIGNDPQEFSAILYRCEVSANGTTVTMNPVYIGFSVHGDVQTLQFDPQGGLWVGCDGGVFFAEKPVATSDEENIHLFKALNTGLATLESNDIGQWPGEDAVFFTSNQDNGCTRYAGAQTWGLVFKSDSGRVIVNWRDPSKVILTVFNTFIELSATAGAPNTFVSSPWITNTIDFYKNLNYSEPSAFYAPMVTTPVDLANPNRADRIAFGTTRPWLSNDFGMSWYPLATNAPAIVPTQTVFPGATWGDSGHIILSMCFTSYSSLYVGMQNGEIWRIQELPPGTWTPELLNGKIVAGGLALPVGWPVTGMARGAGDALYVTFGGAPAPGNPNGFRRVWKYDPAGALGAGEWTSKSGDPANTTKLLNIQYNTIAVDGNDLYAGADIGVWHSGDGGDTWVPFAQGLPESPVMDLKIYPATGNCPQLLRTATYGRGIYEKVLVNNARYTQGVQLYVRANVLDRGLYDITPLDGHDNPLNLTGPQVNHRDGVGLKITQANAVGEFPHPSQIDFYQYDAEVTDDFRHIHAGRQMRMYLEINNRGVVPADDVQVMLLISRRVAAAPVVAVPAPPAMVPVNITPLPMNGLLGPGPQAPYAPLAPPPPQPTNTNPLPGPLPPSVVSPLAGLTDPPDLPATLQADVRAGNLIRSADWHTMAVLSFNDLQAGFPDIVSVDWTAPVAGLYYVVAIVTCPDDEFTQPALAVAVDDLVKANAKVLMKSLMIF